MQNFVQKGRVIDVPSMPATVTSGQAILIGALFGVCCDNYASGAAGEVETQGVFDLPMDASTPTFGQAAYWDNTAKAVTTTATSNTKIGVFVVAGTGATGRVRLNGSF